MIHTFLVEVYPRLDCQKLNDARMRLSCVAFDKLVVVEVVLAPEAILKHQLPSEIFQLVLQLSKFHQKRSCIVMHGDEETH